MKIKIIILSLFVLGSLFFVNNINAATMAYQDGCTTTTTFSATTGALCAPMESTDDTNLVPMPPVFWDGGCTATNTLSSVSGKKCVTFGSSNDIYPVPMPPVYTNVSSLSPVSSDCNSNTNPWVKVISPNGGEKYMDGERMVVQWASCNIKSTDNVHIDLLVAPFPPLPPTGTNGVSLAQTINDGREVVTLPTVGSWPEMIYGNKFKISIWHTSTSPYEKLVRQDISDNLFSINKLGSTDSSDGCTLTTGLSSVAGKPCSTDIYPIPLPPIYSNGCTSTTVFSATTGEKCAVLEPLPPVFWDGGCTATNTLSSVSGKKCVTLGSADIYPIPLPPVYSNDGTIVPMPPVFWDGGCTTANTLSTLSGKKCVTR